MVVFKPADWGGDIGTQENAVGNRLFKRLVLNWSEPQIIERGERPVFDEPRPALYAIIRNHHASNKKDRICYIGLSKSPSKRFQNHPKATALFDKKGVTSLSYTYIDVARSSKRIQAVKRALEDVEHILIWTLWFNLDNEKKMFTLPGMGTTPGDPYHIINEGYTFLGQMPSEIVYPWALVKNRTDRSEE